MVGADNRESHWKDREGSLRETLRAKPGSSALGIKSKPTTEIKASLAYRVCSRLVRATLQTLPQSKGKDITLWGPA